MIETLGKWVGHALGFFGRLCPHGTGIRMFQLFGRMFYAFVRIRRRHVEEQMTSHLDAISAETAKKNGQKVFEHLGACLFELLHHGTSRGRPLTVAVTNECVLKRALESGRGVLVLTAHYGNWELLARYGVSMCPSMKILSKRFSNQFFQGMWTTLRQGSAGVIPATGGGLQLARILKSSGMVGVVLDQHAPDKNAYVGQFLNEKAATSQGAIMIAQRLGCEILMIFTWRAQGGHIVQISEPFKHGATPGMIIDAYHRQLESLIDDYPEQWLWLHRRWKTPHPGALRDIHAACSSH